MAEAEVAPAKGEKKKFEKVVCNVPRCEFKDLATSVPVSVGALEIKTIHCQPKEFSGGSFGWFAKVSCEVKVGDKIVKVGGQVLLIVKGSKEMPL